jgi:hypothetical protein
MADSARQSYENLIARDARKAGTARPNQFDMLSADYGVGHLRAVASEQAPGRCKNAPRLSVPAAGSSIPMRTCAPRPPEDAVIADRGSVYAGTIDSYRAQTASHTDVRYHTVRLIKRRGRHGLRRRCDG